MSLFQWSEEYELGVVSIDHQHRKLVEILNLLHDAMSKGQAKASLAKIFGELIEYTKSHFAAEEKLMQKHNFPGYAAHKAEHAALTAKALELQAEYKRGSVKVPFETALFLRGWLANHILKVDREFANHLIGSRAPEAKSRDLQSV